MRSKYWQLNLSWVVVLAWAVTATTVAAASNCANTSILLRAGYVSNVSEWQEFDTLGRKLVHESGTLQGTELSAGFKCDDLMLQAEITQLDGTRLYDGQTSSGVPVISQSALRQSKGQLQTSLNFGDAWQLGVRLSGQTTWREIASAGGASGYPERYDWTLLSLGAQWTAVLDPGQMTLAAWTGTQLTSSMTLNLPGRDQAMLQVGPIKQVELSAGWYLPLSPAWGLKAEARYRRTEIDQGLDVVIRRNGIPVGVAHQPRTSMVDTPLALRLEYEF